MGRVMPSPTKSMNRHLSFQGYWPRMNQESFSTLRLAKRRRDYEPLELLDIVIKRQVIGTCRVVLKTRVKRMNRLELVWVRRLFCPRCRGPLYFEEGLQGTFQNCLRCGFDAPVARSRGR